MSQVSLSACMDGNNKSAPNVQYLNFGADLYYYIASWNIKERWHQQPRLYCILRWLIF